MNDVRFASLLAGISAAANLVFLTFVWAVVMPQIERAYEKTKRSEESVLRNQQLIKENNTMLLENRKALQEYHQVMRQQVEKAKKE